MGWKAERQDSRAKYIIKMGNSKCVPGKFSELLQKVYILRIETPGGGGYGSVSQNEL